MKVRKDYFKPLLILTILSLICLVTLGSSDSSNFPWTNTNADRTALAALGDGSNVGPVTGWVKLAYLIRTARSIPLNQIQTLYNAFNTSDYGTIATTILVKKKMNLNFPKKKKEKIVLNFSY